MDCIREIEVRILREMSRKRLRLVFENLLIPADSGGDFDNSSWLELFQTYFQQDYHKRVDQPLHSKNNASVNGLAFFK